MTEAIITLAITATLATALSLADIIGSLCPRQHNRMVEWMCKGEQNENIDIN